MPSLKYPPYILTAIILAIFHFPPALAQDYLPEGILPDIQQRGNISYITGGIGDEEIAAIESEKKDYNLQIMNADKLGHFSGSPRIVISDAKHNELINVEGGPLFYAKLPKGHYIVEGFTEGQSRKQAITITGNKPVLVHFAWK